MPLTLCNTYNESVSVSYQLTIRSLPLHFERAASLWWGSTFFPCNPLLPWPHPFPERLTWKHKRFKERCLRKIRLCSYEIKWFHLRLRPIRNKLNRSLTDQSADHSILCVLLDVSELFFVFKPSELLYILSPWIFKCSRWTLKIPHGV